MKKGRLFWEENLVRSLYLRVKILHSPHTFVANFTFFLHYPFFKEGLFLKYHFYFPKKSSLIVSYNRGPPSLKAALWNSFSQLQHFGFLTQIFPNNLEEANRRRKHFKDTIYVKNLHHFPQWVIWIDIRQIWLSSSDDICLNQYKK